MRLEEFKRINLKVIKDDNVIYQGAAEELPEELKKLITKAIKIQPNLAEVIVEDEVLSSEVEVNE